MNKIELEKNRFDLSYKRNLQFLNAILIIGAGSLVAYFAAFILNPEKIYNYSIILVIISALTYVFYLKIDENLKEISNQLKNLI